MAALTGHAPAPRHAHALGLVPWPCSPYACPACAATPRAASASLCVGTPMTEPPAQVAGAPTPTLCAAKSPPLTPLQR